MTRPIIQEVRTNSCPKLRPLMEERWPSTGMPWVKKAHHSPRASPCSARVSPHSPLVSMDGPHSSLGLSLLHLLPLLPSPGVENCNSSMSPSSHWGLLLGLHTRSDASTFQMTRFHLASRYSPLFCFSSLSNGHLLALNHSLKSSRSSAGFPHYSAEPLSPKVTAGNHTPVLLLKHHFFSHSQPMRFARLSI